MGVDARFNRCTPSVSVFVLLAVTSCGGSDHAGASQDTGTVRLRLAEVPADVSCLRLTAEGGRIERKLIDVHQKDVVDAIVPGLPVGTVSMNLDAFSFDCHQVNETTLANWVSDWSYATIVPGQVGEITFQMKRNGRVQMKVEWNDEPSCLPNGAPCGGNAECCSYSCRAGVCAELVPVPEPNRVFVTSTKHEVNFGGLSGADRICNTRASEASIPGTFVALLSVRGEDGRSRLADYRGWAQSGFPFADTVDTLFAPNDHIFYPIQYDERGELVPAGEAIFTGTNADGTSSRSNCSDWTDRYGFDGATVGRTGYGGPTWTQWDSVSCVESARLICFEVDRRAPVAPERPRTARLVFLSRDAHRVGGGLTAADVRCSAEAAAAGLPGSYRALLADSSTSALGRFSREGAPWYRPDWVKVADSADDFALGHLYAPINVTADGTTEVFNYAVWSGAPTPSVPGTETCGDWNSADAALPAAHGVALGTDSRYFGDSWTPLSCDAGYAHLYCLQE